MSTEEHRGSHPNSRANLGGDKAQRASRRERRRMRKLKDRIVTVMEQKNIVELAKTAMQSPVLAGTGAFLIVSAVQSAVTASQAAGQPAHSGTPSNPLSVFLSVFEGGLSNALGPLGGLINTGVNVATGSGNLQGILSNLDFDALKLCILIYIASGGNLAGLLQSSSGLLGGLLNSSAGTIAAEAVVP